MPQKILQKTVDIDYMKNLAIILLFPPAAVNQELVGIAQWICDHGTYEISFQVLDSWQNEGLGRFLFTQLLNAAETYGIREFKADVLADNKAMRLVLEKSGVPYHTSTDFGVVTYVFDLPAFHDCKSA
jgi:GNAT superfamily N-acetyltransferase